MFFATFLPKGLIMKINGVELRPNGVFDGTSVHNLTAAIFPLITVSGRDGNGLLLVKTDETWGIPHSRFETEKYGERKTLKYAMPDILPERIFVRRQGVVRDVVCLGGLFGTECASGIVLCAEVESSCIVLNADANPKVIDHTWVRSIAGLEQVLGAGQPDEFRNMVVRLGVQEAIKQGLLNWGEGATAH